jgi:hypothetical protein
VSYAKHYDKQHVKLAKSKTVNNQDAKFTAINQYDVPNQPRNNSIVDSVIAVQKLPNKSSDLIASTGKNPFSIINPNKVPLSLKNVFLEKAISVSANKSKPDTIKAYTVKSGHGSKPNGPDTRRTEPLGLTGFILTLVAWVLIAAGPLCILGVIFGGVSLGKISRNPGKWKGRGFAAVLIAYFSIYH